MVNRTELTKSIIDNATSSQKRYIIWDAKLAGFGVRVETSGSKTFILKYRTKTGVVRKPTVGRYGELTLKEAREKAKGWLYEVSHGGDPSKDKREKRIGITVAEALERFESEHMSLKKPNTQDQYRRLIKKEIAPALGSKRIDEITPSDVSRLFHKIGRITPVKANRVRAVLSKLFTLAESWGMRPINSNPAIHVERYKEKTRHRDLNTEELKALAGALASVCENIDNTSAVSVIRLLMFTGCRRGEILNLRWSEVDFERSLARLGDSKTGAKNVFLNSAAIEILEGIEELVGCPYVFPSRYRPNGHKIRPMPEWELREVWEMVRHKAGLGSRVEDGVEAFRLHDLRHSFASLGAGEGLSLPQIGALLGHSQSKTTERYADLTRGPNAEAAEIVGNKITTMINTPEKRDADVVDLAERVSSNDT